MSEEKNYHLFIRSLLLLLGALLFVRFFPALWGALAFGVLLFPLLVFTWWLYRRFQKRSLAKQAANSFAGSIEQKMTAARQQALLFREEAEKINQSRLELLKQLEKTKGAEAIIQQKGEHLLRELNQEQALRHAKATFFDTAAAELQNLLEQHKLQEQLLLKEAELEALRANNFDDIAHMDNLRYTLERDKIRLATIGELTHRAAVSPNLHDTEQLHLDLEQQMKQLR